MKEEGKEGVGKETGRIVVSKALNCTCEMGDLAEKVEENLEKG